MILIICGLPGVGKTTLANSIAPLIQATILSTDKIRKELFLQPSYSKRERELVYDVMILIAKYLHKSNINCILDATFNLEKSRQEIKKTLKLSKNEFFIVECSCPELLVQSRLKNRKDEYSDADFSIYKKMQKIYEPVKMNHFDINSSDSPEKNARIIARKIKSLSYKFS